MYNEIAKGAEAKHNASHECSKTAEELANRAEKLAALTSQKLSAYTNGYPECNKEATAPVRQLPPYFEDMRSHFWRIQKALEVIETQIVNSEL